MRFYGAITALGVLTLVSLQGCGHLPSEMAEPEGEEAEKPESPARTETKAAPQRSGRPAHARIKAKPHTVDCNSPAKGFQRVAFRDLYTETGDTDAPFREADSAPSQFDVSAYVWGYDQCTGAGTCEGGDHYWLIGNGPRGDLQTWVVTPQFPRITIQSTCDEKLEVGERFRFSFSHGKLVGFSR